MAIGVSYEDFWHGEPDIVQFTIETERIRQRNAAIRSDMLAWNTGRYVMIGFGDVLSRAFSKGNTPSAYPEEPILALELDEKLAEQKRERDLRKQRDGFLALAAAMMPQNPVGADAGT